MLGKHVAANVGHWTSTPPPNLDVELPIRILLILMISATNDAFEYDLTTVNCVETI